MSVLRKLARQTAISRLSSVLVRVLLAVVVLCSSCRNEATAPVLVANREAQLGHVTLTLFANRTFLLHNADIRGEGDRYEGNYTQRGDTLQFSYSGPIPPSGCELAVLGVDFVVFEGCFSSLRIVKSDPHVQTKKQR